MNAKRATYGDLVPIVRAAVLGALLALAPPALADVVAVPPAIQANLTAKLLAFERNLATRAAGTVRVLVLTDPSEAQSQRVANEFAAALKAKEKIAGMPLVVTIEPFKNAPSLAGQVKSQRLSAIYLSAGLARFAEPIAAALKGTEVMTVAAEPAGVIRGASVGFDLLSGQPKILINLNQAKLQNVQLPSSVLSLAVLQGG